MSKLAPKQKRLPSWCKPTLSVTDVKKLTNGRNATNLDQSGNGPQLQNSRVGDPTQGP